jgi:hypothetical protein
MTLRGHDVEDEANCAKFLYVNLDFRLRPLVVENGEE